MGLRREQRPTGHLPTCKISLGGETAVQKLACSFPKRVAEELAVSAFLSLPLDQGRFLFQRGGGLIEGSANRGMIFLGNLPAPERSLAQLGYMRHQSLPSSQPFSKSFKRHLRRLVLGCFEHGSLRDKSRALRCEPGGHGNRPRLLTCRSGDASNRPAPRRTKAQPFKRACIAALEAMHVT